MFKQLLMVSGFDRYFQIAPCFRDEDARADRAPGEFYQLDFEMSFVTQEDVFAAIEPVLGGVFNEFAGFGREAPRKVTPFPFPRIPYAEALLTYGTDKPDLRNPLRIVDAGEVFAGSDFKVFAGIVASGGVVRALKAPNAASQPRSFFDKLNSWAQAEGKPGLGYIVLEGGAGKGPIAKFVTGERLAKLRALTGAADGDAVFFVADKPEVAWKFAGQARTKVGQEMGLIAEDAFEFCWIVDFPMFEYDRLQRHRALLGRHPQPSPGNHVQGLRHRRLQPRRGRAAIRRHAERLPIRRSAARRRRARRRSYRHAVGRRAQHPRGHHLPDESAGGRPDDGRADRAAAGEAARAAHCTASPAREEGIGLAAQRVMLFRTAGLWPAHDS